MAATSTLFVALLISTALLTSPRLIIASRSSLQAKKTVTPTKFSKVRDIRKSMNIQKNDVILFDMQLIMYMKAG
ncbi:unnamed protein product [Musa acuminata var. zebrina]